MNTTKKTSSHAQVRRLTDVCNADRDNMALTISPIGFTLPFFGISMTFNHIPMIIGTLMEGRRRRLRAGRHVWPEQHVLGVYSPQLLLAAVPEPAYLGSAAAFDRADNLLCV